MPTTLSPVLSWWLSHKSPLGAENHKKKCFVVFKTAKCPSQWYIWRSTSKLRHQAKGTKFETQYKYIFANCINNRVTIHILYNA